MLIIVPRWLSGKEFAMYMYIETCILSYVKRIGSPGLMHETGCLGLVHWGDPEEWDGEGGGWGVQDGEHMYTYGGFMSMYGKTTSIENFKKIKKHFSRLKKKESASQHRRHWSDSWVRKIPWKRKWQPTPVFLPGKSHGQRTLLGCSP